MPFEAVCFYVYVLASQRNGTLYIGVTNSLLARVQAHRNGTGSVFTRRYKVFLLVHFEQFTSVSEAIQRETSLKRWPRKWKVDLIEAENPSWRDLWLDLAE